MKQASLFFKSMMAFLAIPVLFPLCAHSVTLNPSSATIKVGQEITIKASSVNDTPFSFSINPESSIVYNVYQNENSITVKGRAPGTATITCKEVYFAYSATCKVTVSGYLAGYKFYENTAEGVSMQFVVNEDESSCSVYYINKSTTGTVTIPEYARGLKVTGINANAFKECENLSAVIIPNGITKINNMAFYGCKSLKSIVFPSTLTYIGEKCFGLCDAIESVSGFSNVEYIGKHAFYDTAWFKNLSDGVIIIGKVFYAYKGYIPKDYILQIPDGIVMISEDAIRSGASNCDLIIPKSVTTIGHSDDGWGCWSGGCMKSITIDPENPVYDSRDGCSAIIEKSTSTLLAASNSTTEIPFSVKAISTYAFHNYKGLSISIPGNVIKIGKSAFNSSSLQSIDIGSGVKEMENNPFSSCYYLNNISVSPYNSYYDSRDNCNAIIEKSSNKLITGCQKTVIPETIKIIGEYAFSAPYSGESMNIVVPNSVETIDAYAFYYVYNLENITFGKNIKEIGYQIINYRDGLKYIRMLSSMPCKIVSGTFESRVYEKVPLYVPQGSLASYQIADNWKNFKTIKEGEPPVLVTAITLSHSELKLTVGDTQQLTDTVAPDNASDKTVTWSSSNDEVATVNSDGLVTALAKGTATITCKANDESGVTAVCEVTVNNLPPTAVALPNTATVAIGSSITLKPEFTPSNALAELTWSSDNESIAIVSSDGVVTGKKKGQTFINVETDNGKTAYCKLTVTAPEPISIEIPKNVTVAVGETITLTPTITPEGAETTLTWKSDDESVARIDANGVLTGVSEGLALVTVSTSNGLTSNACKVKVEPDPSGISTVMVDEKDGAPIYTPSGQRLVKPKKGINIIGGKKVVVR